MIPMLVMTGTVLNVFRSDEGVTKKGEKYGGRWTIQFLCERSLRDSDGEALQMKNISTEEPDFFKSRRGQVMSLPVSVMNGRDEPTFFIDKAWLPTDPLYRLIVEDGRTVQADL